MRFNLQSSGLPLAEKQRRNMDAERDGFSLTISLERFTNLAAFTLQYRQVSLDTLVAVGDRVSHRGSALRGLSTLLRQHLSTVLYTLTAGKLAGTPILTFEMDSCSHSRVFRISP